ncbi:MAG: tRNA (adenosine(37)-N6)-threonylcarbamoyltransferase complex ATPase subunit type 1 TsaE [Flavobacteriales bacterium]
MQSKSTQTYTAATPVEMERVANALLEQFPQGGHFAMVGEMGAGKTTLMQCICKSLHLPFAGSPTFSLINEYTLHDGRKLYHFDLYRLNSTDELNAIGFEEYLTGAYVFIEWPQIAAHLTDAMTRISITDEGGVRRVEW